MESECSDSCTKAKKTSRKLESCYAVFFLAFTRAHLAL
jgi:hypothetical protein